MKKKITVSYLAEKKEKKEKIVAVTAYDASFARLIDQTDTDIILVGDSLGMVIQGHSNTLSVTLEDMIYHTSSVARGSSKALIIADLPFGTFQVEHNKAVDSAVRLIKEGRAESVKIEGATEKILNIISDLTSHGIPVQGHIGLIPQSIHAFGGFKMQGKTPKAADKLINDAFKLQDAGVHSLVLESIPDDLAAQITEKLKIPTIGIGAGPYCDGQILVIYDILGMDERFNPSFIKKYANLSSIIKSSVNQYSEEVKSGIFPPSRKIL